MVAAPIEEHGADDEGDGETHDGHITVLIVEDHRMVARGLEKVLAEDPEIEVVGTAYCMVEGVALASELHPMVVMMDFNLPDGDGATAARNIQIASPNSKVVVLTAASGSDVVASAIDAGCTGFIDKTATIEELLSAVRASARGDAYITSESLAALLRSRQGPVPEPGPLSEREREVLQLLAEGRSVTEIGVELHLSIHTVRNHVRRAMAHLHVHTRLEAVVAAARAGLIDFTPRT